MDDLKPVCEFCEKTFSSKSNLFKHLRLMHKVQRPDEVADKIEPKKRLQKLRQICHELKVAVEMTQKYIEIMKLSKVFNNGEGLEIDSFSESGSEDADLESLSLAQMKHIKQLVKEKEKMEHEIQKALQKTKTFEEDILKKEALLKDYILRRNKLWRDGAKLLSEVSESGEKEHFANPDDLCSMQDEKIKNDISTKVHCTIEAAKVLNLLICSSGERWAYDPNLLEIVLCIGTLLNDLNPSNVIQTIENVTDRLDSVEI